MRKTYAADALFPKIRQGILAATMMHRERWWYLTDLARHLGVTPSSLQRELKSLVAAGILIRRQEGKQVYFRPDPECPFLAELQGLMAKTVGLADILRDSLAAFTSSIECAFIYGSVARAQELSESDVDLMIIGDVRLAEISSTLRRAEKQLSRPVNATTYTRKEFAQWRRAKNHFLASVLGDAKLFIVGGEDDLAGSTR